MSVMYATTHMYTSVWQTDLYIMNMPGSVQIDIDAFMLLVCSARTGLGSCFSASRNGLS